MIQRKKISPLGKNHKILLLRGLTGTIALSCFFYTIQVMPLASAVTIQYLNPIFTILIASLLLKEHTTKKQAALFVIAFIGAAMVTGFDPRITGLESVIGIVGALFSGIAYNMIRMLKGKEDPLVIVFYFSFVTVPALGLYCVFNWIRPVGVEWLWLLAMGTCAHLAQILLTKGYQIDRASNIAHINFLGAALAFLTGYFVFDEKINSQSLAGMAIILTAVYLALNSRRQATS